MLYVVIDLKSRYFEQVSLLIETAIKLKKNDPVKAMDVGKTGS